MIKELNDWIIDFKHRIAYQMLDSNTFKVKVFDNAVNSESLTEFRRLPRNVKQYLINAYPNIKLLNKGVK